MAESTTPAISSVQRSYAILNHLKDRHGGRPSEIADEMEIAKSTVHKHLSTLEQLGYVANEGGTYHVGLRYLDLGGYARQRTETYQKAIQMTSKVADDTGQRAQFIVEENGIGIFVHTRSTNEAVRLDRRIGKIRPLHASAAGKAILAFLPSQRVDEIIDRHGLNVITKETIIDRESLEEGLAEIRNRGYAFNDEETVEGLRAVGVPLQINDRVVGAISVSGPRHQLKGNRYREELPERLLGYVNELELDLSY